MTDKRELLERIKALPGFSVKGGRTGRAVDRREVGRPGEFEHLSNNKMTDEELAEEERKLFHRAVKLKIIPDDPLTEVASPKILNSKPHRYYREEELSAIYEATRATVNGGPANPEHAAWWRLYAKNTGMRLGEGMHLVWNRVGSDGLQVVSTEEDRTKSGLWRDIPRSKGIQVALEELREYKADEFVLPRMTLPSLSRAFARDATRARVGGSLHISRHTYNSHLVLRGTRLRTVQLYAGHSTIQVTEQYVHLNAICLRVRQYRWFR